MRKPKVAIVKGPDKPDQKQIENMIREAIELIGGLTHTVSRGDTILIKPNIVCAASPGSGVVTDPRVSRTIADMVREIGARPIIAESSLIGSDTEEAIQKSGYGLLRGEGYEVIDLKRKGIELAKVQVPLGKSLKEVTLPKVVIDADAIISVPVMKTQHHQTFSRGSFIKSLAFSRV
jgi:uncharacterized protein (DUF362 family)